MRLLPRTCLLLVCGALASGGAMATNLYQWKDAQGVTHSSDKPPAGQQYEVRRIANLGPVVETSDEAAPAENASCTTARKNLALLGGDAPVQQDTDGDGKADRTLTPEERAAQKTLADAMVTAHCSGG